MMTHLLLRRAAVFPAAAALIMSGVAAPGLAHAAPAAQAKTAVAVTQTA